MKILQTGDNHIGYHQYGLKSRAEDFRKAFTAVVDLAIEYEVDMVTLTGDLFESTKPSPADVNFVRSELDRLERAGIIVVGIEGNHDRTDGEILKLFDAIISVEGKKYKFDNGLTFYGIPYLKHDQLIEALAGVPKDVDVLLMHQTLSEVADIYGDVSADDIMEMCPSVRYVALGHIHDNHDLSRNGGKCRLVYNGSPEMNDIDENPRKTIPIFEIEPGDAPPKVKLVDLEPRTVEKIMLHVDDDVAALHKDLEEYRGSLLYLICKNSLTRQLASVMDRASDLGIIYTVTPVSDMNAVDLSKINSWERSRSTVDLKKIIEEDFDGLPREKALVMALLDTPENANTLIEEYVDEQVRDSEEADSPEERVLQPGEGEA